jgi:hypothetical protein
MIGSLKKLVVGFIMIGCYGIGTICVVFVIADLIGAANVIRVIGSIVCCIIYMACEEWLLKQDAKP